MIRRRAAAPPRAGLRLRAAEAAAGFRTLAGRFAAAVLIAAVLCPGVAPPLAAWPWSRAMARQPPIAPVEADLPPPEGIRPQGGRTRVVDRMDAHARLADPAPGDTASIRAGERLFGLYCATCHGPAGAGDGPVVKTFIPPPPLFPLVGGRTDGYLYGTVRFGGPMMPPYGEELRDGEIWSIVRWLKRENGAAAAR